MVEESAVNDTQEREQDGQPPAPPEAEAAPPPETASEQPPAEEPTPPSDDDNVTEVSPAVQVEVRVEDQAAESALEPNEGASEEAPADTADEPVEVAEAEKPVKEKPKKTARSKGAKKKAEAEQPAPVEAAAEPAGEEQPVNENLKWYVVKVQSGREESIKEAIERRVKIEGLEEYFGEILIPTEKEKVLVKGKRVERERKLFPGYIMAKVDFNDQILYLFRETSGVGDFVGGGPNQKPQPMTEMEVARMTGQRVTAPTAAGHAAGAAPYSVGERVRVKEGVFSGMEGDIKEVLEAKEQVRVELFVLGRPVSVELDYWQVEAV